MQKISWYDSGLIIKGHKEITETIEIGHANCQIVLNKILFLQKHLTNSTTFITFAEHNVMNTNMSNNRYQ